MSSPFDQALALENVGGQLGALARSTYQQESGSGNNPSDSNAGAVGPMQVIPSTFNSVADQGWNIRNPVDNIRAGLRYLKQGWSASGGDPKLTAAYYYGGPGGMAKAANNVAVSDPRNPNAPNTLQYAEQVANRMSNKNDGQDAQLIGPMGSPAADAALAGSDQASQGALSQMSAQPMQAQQPQQEQSNGGGPLSSVMAMLNRPLPTVQEALARYVPQDDSSQRYLAMAAAFGRPTGFGTLGETMSNVASALQQQKQNQDKLRLEYLPHIMQQVAAQQQMEIQRAQMLSGYAMINSLTGGQGGSNGQPQGGAPTGQQPGVAGQGSPQGVAPQMAGQSQGGQGMPSNGLNYPLNPVEMGADMAFNGGKGLPGMIAKRVEPNAFAMQLQQSGIDPKSAIGQQMMQQQIAKLNNIPPVSLRGQAYKDSDGQIKTLPDPAPPGYMNVVNDQGNWSVQPVQGGLAAVQASNAAVKAGANQQTLTPTDQLPVDGNGRPIPRPISATIAGMQPTAPGATPLQPNQQGISQPAPNGQPQGVGLAPGQAQGAVAAQTGLDKRYSDLLQQNSQAQITSSYLQNIKQQAQTAAVGPMSDKIDYANGILSLVGSQKATNAVTANDLLDKYSNQIVSRLGQGGLGTDAARSILQSAYPNAHMNLPAINDAADNLIGSNEMVKAKTQLLAPHGNARDPVSYQQKEQVFDQNSDPRIWQYKALQPGSTAAKTFLQGVVKQDPSFLQKMQKLNDIGAL